MKYAFLFLSLVFLGCQKENYPGRPTLQEQTSLNIAYGSDPVQNMDIYLAAGRSAPSTKVIILIHGGAWSQGDKSDFTSYVD
jgi:acetyl esterase/lipase